MEAKGLIQKIQNWLNVGVLLKFRSKKSGVIRGKLVTMLGLHKKGGYNSSYNEDDIITENGNTLTIRLADHPATESNFKSEKNISLIIGEKADKLVITTVKQSRIYSEVVYKSECFADDKREQTMTEILNGLKAALQTGYYKKGDMGEYNVELNETTPLTPEFKRWFGDSKVVYKNGKPRVVYHGTNTEFDTFDVAKFGLWDNGTKWDFEENKPLKDKGFFFTAAKTTAKDHAEGAVDMAGGKPIVLDMYLRIEKPLIVQVDKFKAQRGYDSQQWFDMWTSKLLHQYEAGDYDGIIVNNPIDDNDKLFVVFSQNQIKSASRNSGAFSLESDSILEGLGSIREEAAPRKTITAYKLMRLVDGKLYPLYIDRSEPVAIGVWYNADSVSKATLEKLPFGYHLIDLKTEKVIDSRQSKPKLAEVKAATAHNWRWFYVVQMKTKIGYKNVGIAESKGEEQVKADYALRPGWHAGQLPVMNQVAKGANKDILDDSFVFTEIEISADVDYNAEAQANGGELYYIPENGYYLRCTNANKKAAQADKLDWYIAGAIRINRIISDSEARDIIDRYNREHGTHVAYSVPRESGKMFNADTMSLEGVFGTISPDQLTLFGTQKNIRNLRPVHWTVKKGLGNIKPAPNSNYWQSDEANNSRVKGFEYIKAHQDIQPTKDTTEFNPDTYTSRDEIRPAMCGIYHDGINEVGVVCNGLILVASRKLYDADQKNNTIATHDFKSRIDNVQINVGDEINKKTNSYQTVLSNWKSVLPGNRLNAACDYSTMAGMLTTMLANTRRYWQSEIKPHSKTKFADYLDITIVYLRLPNGVVKTFSLKLLKDFAVAAKFIGADEIQYCADSLKSDRAIVAASNDGYVLVMPRNQEMTDESAMINHFEHDTFDDFPCAGVIDLQGDEPQTDTLESKLAILKKYFAEKQRAERDANPDRERGYIKYSVRINPYPPEIGKSPIHAYQYPTGMSYSDVRFELTTPGGGGSDYLRVAFQFNETKEVRIECDALPEYKELIAKLKAAQPKKDEPNTEPKPTQDRWFDNFVEKEALKLTIEQRKEIERQIQHELLRGANSVEEAIARVKEKHPELWQTAEPTPGELTEAEKEKLRSYQGKGGSKDTTERGILDEYYTPDYVCEFMYRLAVKYGYTAGKVLEPSCATGNCIRPIYERNDYTHIDAFEINQTSRDICKKLYPDVNLYENYFETAFLEPPRYTIKAKKTWLPGAPYDLVIGNPPYGKHVNRYSAYFSGKDRFAQVEMFFMCKCLELLRSGGLLVFITSTNFMSTGSAYQQAKDRIGEMAELVDAYRLPKVFANTDICTDIIVLRKK